jgi:hypothetical protein
LQTEPPIDPSSLTRWRKRPGEAGVEEQLAETIEAAKRASVIKAASVKRALVDTTVTEKSIAHAPAPRFLLQYSTNRHASCGGDGHHARRSFEVRVGPGRTLVSRGQLSYEHLGSNASRVFLPLLVARNPGPLCAEVIYGNVPRCAYGKALAHICAPAEFKVDSSCAP